MPRQARVTPGGMVFHVLNRTDPNSVAVTFFLLLLYDFMPRSQAALYTEAILDVAAAAALLEQFGLVSQALAQINGLIGAGVRAITAQLELEKALAWI